MKADKVLKLLQITRPTLTSYVKKGLLDTIKKPNGQYDYDEGSVYKFLDQNMKHRMIIYARVLTSGQKKDLQNQVELLREFCFQNGWTLDSVYQDAML
jgi:predicted site-specific integrase-resolvase